MQQDKLQKVFKFLRGIITDKSKEAVNESDPDKFIKCIEYGGALTNGLHELENIVAENNYLHIQLQKEQWHRKQAERKLAYLQAEHDEAIKRISKLIK